MQSFSIQNFKNIHGFSSSELAELLSPNDVKSMLKELLKWEKADPHDVPPLIVWALETLNSKLVRERTLNTPPSAKFKFIDLFAGIGGMRIAFEKAGGACVFTSEWDKYPAKMYEDNFGEKPAGDITKIHAADIPAHDILVAGFPCQPFSIAGVSKKLSMGRAHGFEDKTQGTLFFDVARIIAHHQPKMFLLENVKNLKSHDKGNTFRIIMETLRDELGYTVTEKIIDGGLLVPQHRERIYIVGTLSSNAFQFPEIKKVERTLNDILEPINKKNDLKYTLSDKLWQSLKNHAAKHKAKGNGFGFGLNQRDGRARTLSARYYKDGAEILIAQKNMNPRRLTPKECARLMGFPDNFQITLSDTRAYKCFGNSVVVPIVEKLAEAMIRSDIFAEKCNTKRSGVFNSEQTQLMN